MSERTIKHYEEYNDPPKKRRVVGATDAIREAIDSRKNARERAKTAPIRMTEVARVEHQLSLGYMALDLYEAIFENPAETLSLDQERMFLAHQESVRKLEMSLAALKAKADHSKKSDVELAKELKATGMAVEEILNLYPSNSAVKEALC